MGCLCRLVMHNIEEWCDGSSVPDLFHNSAKRVIASDRFTLKLPLNFAVAPDLPESHSFCCHSKAVLRVAIKGPWGVYEGDKILKS